MVFRGVPVSSLLFFLFSSGFVSLAAFILISNSCFLCDCPPADGIWLGEFEIRDWSLALAGTISSPSRSFLLSLSLLSSPAPVPLFNLSSVRNLRNNVVGRDAP